MLDEFSGQRDGWFAMISLNKRCAQYGLEDDALFRANSACEELDHARKSSTFGLVATTLQCDRRGSDGWSSIHGWSEHQSARFAQSLRTIEHTSALGFTISG